MTALQILNLLKSTRDNASPAILWVHDGKRKAALHDGTITREVDYNEAVMARDDPALNIISRVDGECYAA